MTCGFEKRKGVLIETVEKRSEDLDTILCDDGSEGKAVQINSIKTRVESAYCVSA